MDNSMDPELASEMVKLLAQELKVVRAQLREAERRTSSPSIVDSTRLTNERARALITENESLKADNAALQANVSRLQDDLAQWPPVKAEPGASHALQYEQSMRRMKEELVTVLAEKEELICEKEKASGVQEQLSKLREKYKRSKAERRENAEVLNELRVELLDSAQQLEQSRKAALSEIDFRTFLKELPYKPVEGQPELPLIRPYSRDFHAKFHKNLVGMCEGPYYMNSNEVIWSASGIAFGLVIKPMFQYNPKSNGGTWMKLNNEFDVGQRMDICYLTGKAWHYIGTYERIGDCGAMTIAPATLQHLVPGKVEYASKRTTLFPDLVPPSQTRMIENMYTKGVIKLQCFGIRCVGFNQAFSKELLDMFAPSPPEKRKSNTGIPISLDANREVPKAKRKMGSTDHPTKSKKMRK
ncbi:hypothetical protein BS17DRAFT_771509 [Gyrodon lividus]|nr:hypothetical protein BS17DRAFT_771509 [Gyrodon lividus]